jgi:hypothetical protein
MYNQKKCKESYMEKADLRQVEIMVDGVGWTPCKFSDVLKGDQFRLFEFTGEPVVDEGQTEWVADKNAYQVTGTKTWCLESKED